MKRAAILALVLSLAMPGAGSAQGLADRLVRDLRRLGFDKIAVERTLLGRTRITAAGQDGRREIILNPATGEIMRDLFVPAPTGSGAGGGLTGTDGDNDDDADPDDDDDDDDDDSDDDDSDDDGDSDNSGKGSENSGSDGDGDD